MLGAATAGVAAIVSADRRPRLARGLATAPAGVAGLLLLWLAYVLISYATSIRLESPADFARLNGFALGQTLWTLLYCAPLVVIAVLAVRRARRPDELG